VQLVIGNAGGGSNALVPGGRAITPSTRHAVSFTLPEIDVNCGPGTYVLLSVTLALALASGSGPMPMTLSLFTAEPESGVPQSADSTFCTAFPVPSVSVSAGYYTLTLPSPRPA